MKAEANSDKESKDNVNAGLGVDNFIDLLRETNDEVLQIEELKKHAEKLKENLIRYFTEIMQEYEIEIMIPAESLRMEGENNNDVRVTFLNGSGLISHDYKDGTVKSYRLEDYDPSELISIFNAAIPYLKNALKTKKKEYEEISNGLTKIGKYLISLKEKLIGSQKKPLTV